jgi:phosphate transport system ATP-binding protein
MLSGAKHLGFSRMRPFALPFDGATHLRSPSPVFRVALPSGKMSVMYADHPVFEVLDLDFYYGTSRALSQINIQILPRQVTALIGPSGCGKSTFLRCLNRMNDRIPGARVDGRILLNGSNIYDPNVDLVALRQRVGMVFQKPNPFPQSVFDNVAFGPRVLGIANNRLALEDIVQRSLEQAALWDDVRNSLNEDAEVILMDEPASALDPIATAHIEELIAVLKEHYTIVIVTHNMQQAARVSDMTGFFWLGELIEFSPTARMFTRPDQELTENYITGRMG